jgi:MinD-like ATPase involved in chromosome partitioning or flagellar assembly
MPSAGENRSPQDGQIVTFYSYKGGTGRTMALANVAWILAANGKRVLIADWDLESPGLSRFFQPFMEAEANDRPGIIDLIRRYAWAAADAEISPDALHAGSEEDERERREVARNKLAAMVDEHIGRVTDYAIPLDGPFPAAGALHFLSPGKQTNGDYVATLGALDWDNFYDNLYGALFFDALRELLKREYDYALIDSRTGLSDIADICTIHLPDIVVDCFTLSTQGIEGAAKVADAIRERNERGIAIFPVPMRIDRTQDQKVEDSLIFAAGKFNKLPAAMSEEERREYWAAVEVPYQPTYAYEETLAVFGDRPGSEQSLLSSYERIVARITDGAVAMLPPKQEWLRRRTRLLFSRTPHSSLPEVVLDFSPEDQLWAEWISAVLGSAGITVRWVGEVLAGPGDSGVTRHDVLIVSQSYISRMQNVGPTPRPDVLISVTNAPPPAHLTGTDGLRIIELADLSETEAVDRLIDGLQGRPIADLESEIGILRYPSGDRPVVSNLPARNANFTGRDKVLRELHEQFWSQPAASARPATIEGLSGVGKTQVALEYAYRFGADYDVIWWMNCGLSQYVDGSLIDLALKIREAFGAGVPEEGRGPEVARQLLRLLGEGRADQRWLLIYDNAEDIDVIKDLLPKGGGRVLITSRNERWRTVGTSLEMKVFERQESTSHLRRRIPDVTLEEADQVAGLLGDMPLAVAAAGALMASAGMSVSEYLQLVDQQEMPRLPDGHALREYQPAVVKAWCLSLDRLRDKSTAAARLLEVCSVMAPDISLELIYSQSMIDTLRAIDPSIFARNMIAGLIRQIDLLALIKLDNNARQIQVHGVVQAVVNVRMNDKEKESARRNIHRLLAAARPEEGVDDPKNWARYRLIWPHIPPSDAETSKDAEVRQLLIDRVRYLWVRSDLVRGRDEGEEIERTWKAMLAVEPGMAELPEQLFRLQFNLANILRDLGQFQESYALDQAVLDGQRALLGDKNAFTLQTYSGLAADLRALGDYQAALKLDLQTYESWKDEFGEEYPGTLSTANNLALSYLLTGDFRRALTQDRLTLDRRATELGPTHPRTLNSGSAVARDLLEAGRYADAVARMENVLSQAHSTLGDDDRITLNARLLLGVALRYAGHPEQAASQIDTARTGLATGWGEDSSDALASRLSQAVNMLAMHQVPEGMEAAAGVLAIYEAHVGPKHPHSLITRLNICTALCLAGDYTAAATSLPSVVEGLQERLGEVHPYTLAAKMVQASTLAFRLDLRRAEELERAVTDDRENNLGPRHPDTLRCRANLLLTQHELGSNEASDQRQEVIRELTIMLGSDHPDVKTIRDGGRLLCTIDPQPF